MCMYTCMYMPPNFSFRLSQVAMFIHSALRRGSPAKFRGTKFDCINSLYVADFLLKGAKIDETSFTHVSLEMTLN